MTEISRRQQQRQRQRQRQRQQQQQQQQQWKVRQKSGGLAECPDLSSKRNSGLKTIRFVNSHSTE